MIVGARNEQNKERAADDEAATAVNREAEEVSENEVIAKDSVAAEEVVHDGTADAVIVKKDTAAAQVVEIVQNEIGPVADAERSRHGSPIPQIDGAARDISEQIVTYTFKSDFAEEDIIYTLDEILTDEIETQLKSRVRLYGPRSAAHLCTVVIKLPPEKTFTWPEMTSDQAEVFKDLLLLPA